MTFGQELAAGAEVPEKWRDLMRHVAGNMEAHGLPRLALAYRAMADAADRAAREMRAMADITEARRDPARGDLGELVRWMERKVEMQRELAGLLVRHAQESEGVLRQVRGGAP
jgi:hypothetical protein